MAKTRNQILTPYPPLIMNVQQPNVPGVNLPKLQTQRFTESLGEIILLKHPPKIKFKNGLLISASANTNKPLGSAEINHLSYFADSWNQKIEISKSGEGLKIAFQHKNS